MDPLDCSHRRFVIDKGFLICDTCGMELGVRYVENGDQEKTKKTATWKNEMFGTIQPECVVLSHSIPDRIPCGTCVVNNMRIRVRLVNLAIAFCKIDLVAKSRNRKRDKMVASLALLYRECKSVTSDTAFVEMVHVSPTAKVRSDFTYRVITRVNNRMLPLRTFGAADPDTFPKLSQHIFDELINLLDKIHFNRTRIALMKHIEQFTLQVESHLRRVTNPTSNSRAIVWKWAFLEQTKDDIKRGVRKDLYGEMPTWMDVNELIENIPDIQPVRNATYLQTFPESFIEALGNADNAKACEIESVLCDNSGGVLGGALCDLVCEITAEQLVDACPQFTNDPIPVLRNKKGEYRTVDMRFRCSGCPFGRCSRYMNGGISKTKEIDGVWNDQFALTGIVANRLCNLFPRTVDGFERLDAPSVVKYCQLHCGEAFWRSAFVRTRLQGSITAAAVMAHPDGYFLSTLPDHAWHKMSVACTAATIGFYESFVAPVIEECVGRCPQGHTTSTKVASICKRFTYALSMTYSDFLSKKGNPEVDAVACMRLLQYLRISNDKKVSRTQQALTSKDGTKTVAVPNMPLAFGMQRNNAEFMKILEETFVNSRGMARYRPSTQSAGLQKLSSASRTASWATLAPMSSSLIRNCSNWSVLRPVSQFRWSPAYRSLSGTQTCATTVFQATTTCFSYESRKRLEGSIVLTQNFSIWLEFRTTSTPIQTSGTSPRWLVVFSSSSMTSMVQKSKTTQRPAYTRMAMGLTTWEYAAKRSRMVRFLHRDCPQSRTILCYRSAWRSWTTRCTFW